MSDYLLLVGDREGEGCGIGDFVGVLHRGLVRNGIDAEIMLTPHFSAAKAAEVGREIARRRPKLVHFNFASASAGKDPAASLMPLVYRQAPWLVTVHEFQVLHPLRRLSLFALPLSFDHYVFSNAQERDRMAARQQRIGARSSLIPVPSNIRVLHPPALDDPARLKRLIYFGLIAPNKGLEAFVEACEAAAREGVAIKPVIVGATLSWAQNYADEILSRARRAGCDVFTDAPEAEVSRMLASCAFAYLPYPDGASLKRGSLAAALAHQCIVATTWSAATPDSLRAATIEANTPAQALAAIRALQTDEAARAGVFAGMARHRDANGEDAVAAAYAALYKKMTQAPAPTRR